MFVIRREPHNPLLAPRRTELWEALATYNPSAIRTNEGVRVYYRALGSSDTIGLNPSISTIGSAFSEDGIHFHSRKQVITPDESWDAFGCEDPRVSFFEGRWYCFYTALGGYPFGPTNIKVACAVSDDSENFTERHLITPFNAKAATLFPERIDGDVVLLLTAHTDWTEEHPRPTIAIARAKEVSDFFDPTYWQTWHENLEAHALPDLRRNDHDHVEVGAAPFLTEKGWVLIYSYIGNYYDERKRIFSVEAVLLDANDPQKLISRTDPFLIPEAFYEEYGLVPNIVFPTSTTLTEDGMLEIWYGGADMVCAKASVRFSDLLDTLDPNPTKRIFTRANENPILSPKGNGFESRDVFNAAAVDIEGTVYILYRAMGAENTSTVGLALSKDGITIDERLPEPIYVPRADFEQKHGKSDGNSGCEDARIVHIGDRLYMNYTAYDGVQVPAGAVTSISVADFVARRFENWTMPYILTPEGIDDKDLALLPAKVDGNFLLYHRISGQMCADLLPSLSDGKRVSRCIEILKPRPGMWDSAKVGIAGPPVPAGENWLLIYHGVSATSKYQLGAALLDASGTRVIARTADPIFGPEMQYEKEGEIPNVVFSCGAVVRGDTVFLYYGGADRVIGVATASLTQMLEPFS